MQKHLVLISQQCIDGILSAWCVCPLVNLFFLAVLTAAKQPHGATSGNTVQHFGPWGTPVLVVWQWDTMRKQSFDIFDIFWPWCAESAISGGTELLFFHFKPGNFMMANILNHYNGIKLFCFRRISRTLLEQLSEITKKMWCGDSGYLHAF